MTDVPGNCIQLDLTTTVVIEDAEEEKTRTVASMDTCDYSKQDDLQTPRSSKSIHMGEIGL
jgi:hypothetical protein